MKCPWCGNEAELQPPADKTGREEDAVDVSCATCRCTWLLVFERWWQDKLSLESASFSAVGDRPMFVPGGIAPATMVTNPDGSISWLGTMVANTGMPEVEVVPSTYIKRGDPAPHRGLRVVRLPEKVSK